MAKHHTRLQDEGVFGHRYRAHLWSVSQPEVAIMLAACTQRDLGCLATERFRHRPRPSDQAATAEAPGAVTRGFQGWLLESSTALVLQRVCEKHCYVLLWSACPTLARSLVADKI